MSSEDSPVTAAVAGSLLGTTATAWHSPEFGLSDADRLVVSFVDGRRAFVKGATTDETAGWLRNEHRILEHVAGTGLAPEVLAWKDDGAGQPVLVTEDLSDAYWPAAGAENPAGGTSTVWRPGDVDIVLGMLDRLRRIPLPPGLQRTPSWPEPHWPRIIELADRLVELGAVGPGWLQTHAEILIAADTEADELMTSGTTLVHGDVRSDNACILGDPSEREGRLVDWSHAGVGHELHDLVQLLPGLRLEEGPPPQDVLIEPAPLIARLAGPSFVRACVTEQPDWLRRVFVRLAAINAEWLASALGLPSPVPHEQPPR